MSDVTLSAAQIAELRSRWVYDEYTVGPPVVARSVYNRRYSAAFFTDTEIKALARRAVRRWGAVLSEAGPLSTVTELLSGDGGGFGTGPGNKALVVAQAAVADDGVTVILYGSAGAATPYTLEYEVVTLSKNAAVTTTRTNWRQLLGVWAQEALTADVAITPNGGGDAIATITVAAPEQGLIEVQATYGAEVMGSDLLLDVDPRSVGAVIGVSGIGLDSQIRAELVTVLAHRQTPIPAVFHQVEMLLVGSVPATSTVSLLEQGLGTFESEENLFRGVQVLAFEAYLGSDQYTRALEDQASAVHQAWQTRIDRDLRLLDGRTGGRSAYVSVER
jgi:hypothetical protein